MNDNPPEITGWEKRKDRGNFFKLKRGWTTVPGYEGLLHPSVAQGLIQGQPAMQYQHCQHDMQYQHDQHMQYHHDQLQPTTLPPHGFDWQMAQYQMTMQQTMHQYQAIMHQYQATMHQSFQNYWAPQYPTNFFAYQPTPPALVTYNPPPKRRHPFAAHTDAIVKSTSNPVKKRPGLPEAIPGLPAKVSNPVKETKTPVAESPSLEDIAQDIEYVLLSEPECTWTIHDIGVDLASIEQLKRKYSGNTFQLLRATTPNPRPTQIHVVLPDEGHQSIPLTEKTTELLFIIFQETPFNIGHWIILRLNLADRHFDIFDTQEPSHKHSIEACSVAINLADSASEFKGLAARNEKRAFTWRCEQTFEPGDGENCGPISWAHIEAALDPSNKPAISENFRLRHLTQVYRSLVAVGVAQPPVCSDDVVVYPKRKQVDVPSGIKQRAKKVAKTSSVQKSTIDRPRRQPRVPGQYREIPPCLSSDDDDDYEPITEDTEEEDENYQSEHDNSD